MNATALAAFNQQLNSYANVRDFLMTYTSTLPITTVNSIKLQASSLSQLTQATNQLTRSALVSILDLGSSPITFIRNIIRCWRQTSAISWPLCFVRWPQKCPTKTYNQQPQASRNVPPMP
jgi:hypothetical protein